MDLRIQWDEERHEWVLIGTHGEKVYGEKEDLEDLLDFLDKISSVRERGRVKVKG